MRLLFYLIIITIICSCSNQKEHQHDKKFYKDGKIIRKIIYHSKTDSTWFEYNKSGEPVKIVSFSNGKHFNKEFFFETSKRGNLLKVVGSINEGIINGIVRYYNKDWTIVNEYFYEQDSLKYSKTIVYFKYSDEIGYITADKSGDILMQRIMDSNLNVIEDSLNFYYDVETPEIAITNMLYKLKIIVNLGGYGTQDNKLVMDGDTLNFDGNELEMTITPKSPGYKLITGEIYATRYWTEDSIDYGNDYYMPFYHEYYVADFYDYILPFYEERSVYLYDNDSTPIIRKPY